MARAIVIVCVHDRFKSIFAIQSFAMSAKVRTAVFPRRSLKVRSPPN
jgi:hypothetical protein